jgi:hypothetical protein
MSLSSAVALGFFVVVTVVVSASAYIVIWSVRARHVSFDWVAAATVVVTFLLAAFVFWGLAWDGAP